MRLYIFLILLAVIMAFYAGNTAFLIKAPEIASKADIEKIEELKQKFKESVSPISMINFNSTYHNTELFKLLDPNASVTTTKLDYSSSNKCFQEFKNIMSDYDFEKVWIWEEYRCGVRKNINDLFFKSAPYMHPSGNSYAYLELKHQNGILNTRKKINNFLKYFHTTELKKLNINFSEVDRIYAILASLNDEELRSLSKGNGTILSKSYLLARVRYPAIFSILEYKVYSRESLDDFLSTGPYVLENFDIESKCFYKDGRLCWGKDVTHLFRSTNSKIVSLFFLSIIFVIILIRLIFSKLRKDRLEDQRKKTALQVLTHEFRTPISSLLLTIERLNKNIDKIPIDLQDDILRASSEIYRLQRLSETSKNYLNIQSCSKKLFHFNLTNIESTKVFFEDFVNDYRRDLGDEFKYSYHGDDTIIRIDVYWFSICLKNLIENAKNHGEFPIEFKVVSTDSNLSVHVIDLGKCQFNSLNEMIGEFIKGNHSLGSGLGLNIVHKLLKDMNCKFSFISNPTTFSITIKRENNE